MHNPANAGNIQPSCKIQTIDFVAQIIKRIKLNAKIKSLLQFLQLKKQLCANEEQQLAIFEQAPVSIVFTDLAFNLVKTNRQFLKQFGYNEHEISSLSDVFTTARQIHLR